MAQAAPVSQAFLMVRRNNSEEIQACWGGCEIEGTAHGRLS